MQIQGCTFPEGLLYDVESNVWARLEEQYARIGINSILSWLSGGFISVTFKPRGSQVARGKSIGAIEGPRHFDVVRAPLSGEVLDLNESLRSNPKALNSDPYGEGWFAKIKPVSPHEETRLLNDLRSAREGLERKIKELRVHCFVEFPDHEMFEIGVECSAVLVKLNELLERSATGTVVHIVSDDPTAEIEMSRWSDQTGNPVLEGRVEDRLYHFIVKKAAR